MSLKWIGRPREKLLGRLVFSAKARCDCGAGLAYDRRGGQRIWDCSSILLGDALLAGEHAAVNHTSPCGYFDIVSERNRAANGASTRPSS